jgi:flagellar biosynthesis repressor protein FlbT
VSPEVTGAGTPGREEGMPLKLSLKPSERFVVNGAVLQNGDRRAVLLLQNKASILREKDIIQPEDANTPAKRIYFPIMMMYLDPAEANKFYDEFVLRLNEFMGAIRSTDILKECVSLSREVMAADYYKALTRCRKLLTFEQGLLGNVDPGLPDRSAED